MSERCHLCGADLADAITVGTTGRHGDEFHTVACAHCGLVQTTPLPSEADLAAYYSGPYRATFTCAPVRAPDGTLHEWGTLEAGRLMDAGAQAYAAEIAARLSLGRAHDVLEVGCGDGRLAAALGAHCVVQAIEADPDMAHEARARTWWVDTRTLAQFSASSDVYGRYDAVVSCHVLEHFRDPLAALAQMRSLLREGGRVWLEVPNTSRPYGDLDMHFWQRPHLYNFTQATLMMLLLRAGFESVHVAEDGHVLYAYATHGAREPMAYEAAAALYERATGQRVQTGAEVAAMLDAYRARWRRRTRTERATETLRAFRAGGDVDLDALRDAVDLLGEQSHVAAQIASRALRDGAAMVQLLDEQIAVAEGYSDDPWELGRRAGKAEMAAQASHALGHYLNALKLIEVEGTR